MQFSILYLLLLFCVNIFCVKSKMSPDELQKRRKILEQFRSDNIVKGENWVETYSVHFKSDIPNYNYPEDKLYDDNFLSDKIQKENIPELSAKSKRDSDKLSKALVHDFEADKIEYLRDGQISNLQLVETFKSKFSDSKSLEEYLTSDLIVKTEKNAFEATVNQKSTHNKNAKFTIKRDSSEKIVDFPFNSLNNIKKQMSKQSDNFQIDNVEDNVVRQKNDIDNVENKTVVDSVEYINTILENNTEVVENPIRSLENEDVVRDESYGDEENFQGSRKINDEDLTFSNSFQIPVNEFHHKKVPENIDSDAKELLDRKNILNSYRSQSDRNDHWIETHNFILQGYDTSLDQNPDLNSHLKHPEIKIKSVSPLDNRVHDPKMENCVREQRYFTRWFKKLSDKFSNSRHDSIIFFVNPKSLEQLKKLSTSEKFDVVACDAVISDLISNATTDHSYNFIDMPFYRDSDYVCMAVIVIVCVIILGCIINLFQTRPFSVISFILFFIIPVLVNYYKLYNLKIAEKHHLASSMHSSQCTNTLMANSGIFAHIWEYIRHTSYSEDCKKYYQAVMIDPFYEINILIVITDLISSVFSQIFMVFAETLNTCVKTLFYSTGIFEKLFIFFLFGLIFIYKIKLPSLSIFSRRYQQGSSVEEVSFTRNNILKDSCSKQSHNQSICHTKDMSYNYQHIKANAQHGHKHICSECKTVMNSSVEDLHTNCIKTQYNHQTEQPLKCKSLYHPTHVDDSVLHAGSVQKCCKPKNSVCRSCNNCESECNYDESVCLSRCQNCDCNRLVNDNYKDIDILRETGIQTEPGVASLISD